MSLIYTDITKSSTTISGSQELVTARSTYSHSSVMISSEPGKSEVSKTISRVLAVSLKISSDQICVSSTKPSRRQVKLWERWKGELTTFTEGSCCTFQSKMVEILRRFTNFAKPENNELMDNFILDLEKRTLSEVNRKYFNDLSLNRDEWKLPWWSDIQELFTAGGSGIDRLLAEDIEKIGDTLLSKEVQEAPIVRDRLMKLLVNRKEQKDPTFHGYVLAEDELVGFLSLHQSIDPNELPGRMHLLVRCGVHYTTIILEKKKDSWEAFVLDAAADDRAKGLVTLVKKFGFQNIHLIGVEDRIQYDRSNCAFFAFAVAKATHKLGSLSELLKTISHEVDENGIKQVLWSDMPEAFVQYTTSKSFINKYLEKHSHLREKIFKNGQSFADCMKGVEGEMQVKGELRRAYVIIPNMVAGCRPKVKKELSRLELEELDAIVNTQSVVKLLSEKV